MLIVVTGTLEAGLRAVGYGDSMRLLVRRQAGGQVYYAAKKAFYQHFLGSPIDDFVSWEEFEFEVPAEKEAGTYRVFVFGGSAASGSPPDLCYGFWRILQAMLRARFPDTRFEVYNIACPGATSYAMREAARECAALDPDFFVAYMGNNEVTGRFGAGSGTVHQLLSSMPLIRVTIAARRLRTAQLAKAVLQHVPVRFRANAADAATLDPNHPSVSRAYRRYQANLEDMCNAGMRAGAKVVLCTVGCNLKDWAPFRSRHRGDLSDAAREEWQAHYDAASIQEEAGNYAQAVRLYEQAASIDDTFADLSFRMGRCWAQLGHYEKGYACFVRARETDYIQARAGDGINRAIRRAASEHDNAFLADAERALREGSPHGTPGWELFHDCVHPRFAGNYAIASVVFELIVTLLPDETLTQARGEAMPPSDEECARRLAFTPWMRKQHITSMGNGLLGSLNEAFSQKWRAMAVLNQQQQAALDARLGGQGIEIQAEAYRLALKLHGRDYLLQSRYVKTLLDLGDTQRAREQARLLAASFPCRSGAARILETAQAAAGE